MPPAAKSAPFDYLGAVVIAAIMVGTSFVVEPPTTRWIVFGVGVGMLVAILLAALRPAKAAEPPNSPTPQR